MRSLWYWRLWACPRIARGAACLVTLGFYSLVQPPIFAHSFLVSLIGFLGRVGACLMRDEV